MSNECLTAVLSELDKHNVPHKVEHGGKHLRVSYGESYQHLFVVAVTPSDWRAPLNDRAQIRRDLEKHGLVQKEEPYIPDNPLLALIGGAPKVYSYDVADRFGKMHKNVLRDIDRLKDESDVEFYRLNFEPIEYADQKGRKYRAFRLTKNGFALLAMGFTGKAATALKIQYLAAFEAMEDEIRRLSAASQIPARMQEEFDAAVTLMLEAAGQMQMRSRPDADARQVKPRFVRPSLIRRQKRLRRAG